MNVNLSRSMVATVILGAILIFSAQGSTHCDTLDGPVIKDAKAALAQGEVTPVLKWVTKENEPEIKMVFGHVLKVRAGGGEARDLADRYFFETLVRVHRAGEGALYTGLKPAGQVEPGVKEADEAMAAGSVDDLAKEIGALVEKGVRERFNRVKEREKQMNHNVDAGRAYVAAYIDYVHFVEKAHALAEGGEAHGEAEAPAHQP